MSDGDFEFEERAAIMEYDGGLDRAEAERCARAIVEGREWEIVLRWHVVSEGGD